MDRFFFLCMCGIHSCVCLTGRACLAGLRLGDRKALHYAIIPAWPQFNIHNTWALCVTEAMLCAMLEFSAILQNEIPFCVRWGLERSRIFGLDRQKNTWRHWCPPISHISHTHAHLSEKTSDLTTEVFMGPQFTSNHNKVPIKVVCQAVRQFWETRSFIIFFLLSLQQEKIIIFSHYHLSEHPLLLLCRIAALAPLPLSTRTLFNKACKSLKPFTHTFYHIIHTHTRSHTHSPTLFP